MPRKKRSPASSPPDDPATRYASGVVAGEIIAGPHVRDACARHLRDLSEQSHKKIVWDAEAAGHALSFFREVLKLNGGEFEGVAYNPLGWQEFIISSLFGWKGEDGARRFRVAYIETAKGSGKSPLAAGIGLFGLVADGEARAEIYAAATKKDQAMILFRDAVAMRNLSPELASRLKTSGTGENVWNLSYYESGSFFRPISADDGQSGPRPHISLLDEIHEHRNGYVVEMLKAGQKSRRQPLMLMITNSGTDKRSVCWDFHDYAIKVSSGQILDESFFGYVCALDEKDNPLDDEACWPKANPSLPDGLPGLRYLREQVTQAKGMPSRESMVRRLNFCQWVEAESPWISSDVWFSAEDPNFDPTELIGRRCWGGLDLSSTQDLTAFELLFEPTESDPFYRLKSFFWLPGEGLHKKADQDRVPYLVWRDAGHLEATPGRAIDKRAVLHRIAELVSFYDVQDIGFDRWRIEDFEAMIDAEGVAMPPMIPFGQGFKDMAPAVDEFERLLIDGQLKHDGNPVMTWCAANAVIATDPAGNRKITKERATGRVDGIVAAIMAAGRTLAKEEPTISVYEEIARRNKATHEPV